MARIRMIDLFTKGIADKLNSNSFKDTLGKAMVKEIKTRTRAGYGVKREGGPKSKFPRLKASTIKSRTYKYRNGQLAAGVGPKTNALIESGQLHDSISYKVKSNKVTLYLENGRDDGISNNDLARWQEEKGRSFFHLSKKEEDKVDKIIRAKVKELIKKF